MWGSVDIQRYVFSAIVLFGIAFSFFSAGYTSQGPQKHPDESKFFEFVRNGEINRIRNYIKEGGNVNIRNRYGYTPLQVAIIWTGKKRGEIIDALLTASDIDLDARDNHGMTALYIALTEKIDADTPQIATHLVVRGADVTLGAGEAGSCPLRRAFLYGYTDLAKFLIDKGADKPFLNATRVDSTPLHWVFSCDETPPEKRLELMKFLVARGHRVDIPDTYGYTPLHRALSRGADLNMARFLIDKGADLYAQAETGKTPLQSASESSRQEILGYIAANQKRSSKKSKSSNLSLNVTMFLAMSAISLALLFFKNYRAHQAGEDAPGGKDETSDDSQNEPADIDAALYEIEGTHSFEQAKMSSFC